MKNFALIAIGFIALAISVLAIFVLKFMGLDHTIAANIGSYAGMVTLLSIGYGMIWGDK